MSLDLEAIMARDAALRDGGEAWRCPDCYSCSECQTLRPCEAHDDDTDVIVLAAEVRRLWAQLAACPVDHPEPEPPVDCLCGDPDCWDGLA